MKTTNLPTHLAHRIAAQHPEDAAARGIVVQGINDPVTMSRRQRVGKIASAATSVNTGPASVNKERRPNKFERRCASGAWPEFAAKIRGELKPRNLQITFFLPGLMLYSENSALHGEDRGSGRGKGNGRQFVQVRNAALQEARLAYQHAEVPGGNFENYFTDPVHIKILQFCRTRKIDPGNLYHKPVIDCLTERNGGLGIITDDSAHYVELVTIGYGGDARVGVEVEIMPANGFSL